MPNFNPLQKRISQGLQANPRRSVAVRRTSEEDRSRRLARWRLAALTTVLALIGCAGAPEGDRRTAASLHSISAPLLPIRLSGDGRHFVSGDPASRFVAWGFNYTKGDSDRLLKDYWVEDWAEVAEDFAEMAPLGANACAPTSSLGAS